jgi:hypothetical protein
MACRMRQLVARNGQQTRLSCLTRSRSGACMRYSPASIGRIVWHTCSERLWSSRDPRPRASWAFPHRRSASGCRGRERRSWDSLEPIVVSSMRTTRVAAYGDYRARKRSDESTLQRYSSGGPSPPRRFQASSTESDGSKQSGELPRSTERCPRQILGRNCSKRFRRPSVASLLRLMTQPCARTMTAIGAVTRMHLFTVEASAALV